MAPSLTKWDRLIRYVSAKDGKVRYGEPIVGDSKHPDIDALALKGGLKVKVLEGPTPIQAAPTGEEDEVKELLGPLTPHDVPVIRCVGLNYKTHSKFNSLQFSPNGSILAKGANSFSSGNGLRPPQKPDPLLQNQPSSGGHAAPDPHPTPGATAV